MKLCFVLTNIGRTSSFKIGEFLHTMINGVRQNVWRRQFYDETQIDQFNKDGLTLSRTYAKKFNTVVVMAVTDAVAAAAIESFAPKVVPQTPSGLPPVEPPVIDPESSGADGGDVSQLNAGDGNSTVEEEAPVGRALVDAPAPHERTPEAPEEPPVTSEAVPAVEAITPAEAETAPAPVKARGSLASVKAPKAPKAAKTPGKPGRPKKTA